VTERQSGLRFDIYERVHLADNQVGIKELNEVELVPHMEVYTESDQALLKGNLYLTGSYAGEAGEDGRTLEHLIPVEITLPLNRIHDVREVAVEIDQFDVDLLNSRSLNVTGVLTLHGIEMLSAPEGEWRSEEETVFVHDAPNSGFGDISPAQQREFEELEEEPSQQEESLQAAAELEEPVQEQYQAVFAEYSEEGPAQTSPAAEPGAAIPENVPPEQPVQDEKREVKIALGSKSSSEGAYHLKSLLHNEQRSAAAGAIQEQPVISSPRLDAVEWKKLFVREEAEERFSRMRACIVQKEETLDSIAQRYNINAKEILLYNRVSEQDLEEGKVLLIPR